MFIVKLAVLEDLHILAKLRTNEQIRVPSVRVINAEGEQLGVIATFEALRIARNDGLDLVEVAPKENPPVCRILDYGKFKYQQQKKEHKSRKKQHVNELKELRLRPKTDKHDLGIKVNRARGFLQEGYKVQFTMIFRGRERMHQDRGRDMFRLIGQMLADCAKIEREGRLEGRRMIIIMAPGAVTPGSTPKPKPAAAPAQPKPPAVPAQPKPAQAAATEEAAPAPVQAESPVPEVVEPPQIDQSPPNVAEATPADDSTEESKPTA